MHNASNVFRCAQAVGHGLQGPCEGQNEDGGNHGLKPFGDAGHALLEGQDAASNEKEDGEDQCHGGTQHQTHGGGAVCKSADEGFAAEEAAGVDQANDAGDDQHDHRQNQVDDSALGGILMGVSVSIGTVLGGEQVALEGVAFMECHGAEVGLGDGQGDHHEDGQQGIEVIRNGGDEQGDAVGVAFGGETGNGRCPRADGRDDADRSCGGVDQIS